MTVGAVPGETLRIAESRRILLRQESRVGRVRIIGRNAVLAVAAGLRVTGGGQQRIDAEDRAVGVPEHLREPEGIAPAAAVTHAEIQVAAVGAAARGRIEGKVAPVVIRVGARDPQHLAERLRGVRRDERGRRRVRHGPLQEHLVVVVLRAGHAGTEGRHSG